MIKLSLHMTLFLKIVTTFVVRDDDDDDDKREETTLPRMIKFSLEIQFKEIFSSWHVRVCVIAHSYAHFFKCIVEETNFHLSSLWDLCGISWI